MAVWASGCAPASSRSRRAASRWELEMSRVWTAVAGVFDVLSALGPLAAGLIALALGAAYLAAAWGLQRRLVALVSTSPHKPVPWWKLEASFSLPGLLWWPFDRLLKGLLRLVGTLRRKFHREAAAAPPTPANEKEAPVPLLVATLGPSYLLGALVTAGLYGLARLLEILLRTALGLAAGVSPWQVVTFGQSPDMGAYVPLDSFPYVAALAALGFWLAVAVWASRTTRVLLRGRLGRNLAAEREDASVLGFWRRQAGASLLFRPDRSYSGWASWVVAWAFPLLVWAWLSLAGEPWRVAPGELAVATVLWLSWAAHLLLRGVLVLPPREDPEHAA